MTTYEVVFEPSGGASEPAFNSGDLLEISGERWEVATVEAPGSDRCVRIHLVQQGRAHVDLPRPLQPPTSFESELVYTLTDLSTRLSTLAHVLRVHWGKDAA